MGHSVSLPTRRITLPRVKFKKPRWPRGNRFWLVYSVINTLWVVRDLVAMLTNTKAWTIFGMVDMDWGSVALQIFFASWGWWMYAKSRDDDSGPKAE